MSRKVSQAQNAALTLCCLSAWSLCRRWLKLSPQHFGSHSEREHMVSSVHNESELFEIALLAALMFLNKTRFLKTFLCSLLASPVSILSASHSHTGVEAPL